MTSVQNFSALGSMAIEIMRAGTLTERIVLRAALVGTGLFVAYKVGKFIASFFTPSRSASSLPNFTLTNDKESEIRAKYEQQYPVPPAVKPDVKKPAEVKEEPLRAQIVRLSINRENITTDKEEPLAEALHAYQKLKTDIGGDDERFHFFSQIYAQQGYLPAELPMNGNVVAVIPFAYNKLFEQLSAKLREVGLSLKSLLRTNVPIANVELKNNDKLDIFDLDELYKVVKFQGPHILSRFEIDLNKRDIEVLREKIHETRLKIIERSLSTIRAVFIDDLVTTMPEKHKEVYAILGSDPETLRFMLENICWHALDRAFETIEITFTSNQKQKNVRKVTLEKQLANVLKDEDKKALAQSYLLVIIADPYDDKPMGLLINLLLDEKEPSPEKEALIKKLQEPKLQSEEESLHLEHGRLEAVQKFYHAVSIAAAVADEGKNALLKGGDGQEEKHEKITYKAGPAKVLPLNHALAGQGTYAFQIEELSYEVVGAGENAVKTVASERWEDVLKGLDLELKELPAHFQEIAHAVIEQGWVRFNHKEALLNIPGKDRWIITKKMLIEKLKKNSLQVKGRELVQEVGKGVSSFVKTLYGRLITALLAFDNRTKEATPDDPKPADRIATTFLDSILQCYDALKQVKKDVHTEVGRREVRIVKELEKADEIHPSASNTPGADAVFLGKLIIELLSVLQPEGMTEDIRKILTTALSQPGQQEPTLMRKAIEKYFTSIHPAAGRWIKPVSVILVQALENIIEKRSTNNFAKQLSDWLNPANINAYLVKFFKDDETGINIEFESSDKIRTKWYEDDEQRVKELLQARPELAIEVKVLEQLLEEHKKNPKIEGLENISQQLKAKETRLVELDHLKELDRPEIERKMKAVQGELEDVYKISQGNIEQEVSEQLGVKQKQLSELVLQARLLQEFTDLEGQIKALLKLREAHNKIPQNEAIAQISQELITKRTGLEIGDLELVPLLLRRYLIANVKSSFVPYVLQFADDLFELIQYPRILRHIVFNVLEKSVQSLAKPLEDNESVQLLQQPLEEAYNKSVFDFLFSDQLKTSFGNKLGELFYRMAPTEESWTYLGLITKVATKTVVTGQFIFSKVQQSVEKLIQDKYQNRDAINYSVARMVVSMNTSIINDAKNPGEEGLTARVASQLRAIVGVKKEPLALEASAL